MSYDTEFDYDEEELDDGFLDQYRGGSKTFRPPTRSLREDDDEDEDLFWLERKMEHERERELAHLMRMAAKHPVSHGANTHIEIEKSQKKTPREARSFVRHARKKSGDMQNRKRLTYYLSPAHATALKTWAESKRRKRRDVVMSALRKLVCAKTVHISHPAEPAKFKERIFLFDEVPADLWDVVEAHCRSESGERVHKHYEIVEEALRRAGICQ